MPRRTLATKEEITKAPVGALLLTGDQTTAWRKTGPGKTDWQAQKPHASSEDGWAPRTDQQRPGEAFRRILAEREPLFFAAAQPPRTNPFLARPIAHRGKSARVKAWEGGFHTTSDHNFAVPYAQLKYESSVAEGDQSADDWPVILTLDMAGFTALADIDDRRACVAVARELHDNDVNDTDALLDYAEAGTDYENEYPEGHEPVQNALWKLASPTVPRVAMSCAVEAAHSNPRFVEELYAIARKMAPALGDMAREDAPLEPHEHDFLTRTFKQSVYMEDIPEDRLVSVRYMQPFFRVVVPEDTEDESEEAAIQMYSDIGYALLSENADALPRLASFSKEVWTRGKPVGSKARLEWHGTSLANLRSECPDLVLPEPPRIGPEVPKENPADATVYHVTYLVHLPSIQEQGLAPGSGGKFGGHQARSKGRTFFTEWGGVRYWFDKLDSIASGQSDHPEEGWVPIVLRIDASAFRLEPDPEGSKDSYSEAFFLEKTTIAPSELEVWDGDGWGCLDEVDFDTMLDRALAAATVEVLENEYDDEGQPVQITWMDGDVFLPPGAVHNNPSATEALAGMIEDADAGDFSEHFGEDPEDVQQQGEVRYGRKVVWVGSPGKMVEVDKNYVVPISGNQFHPDKLAAVAEAVRAGERPTLFVGYGTVQIVDQGMIDEADAYADDTTEVSLDRPLDEHDLGKLLYTIRNGNHRTFGALIGGETKVWMNLESNQLQDVEMWRASRKRGAKHRPLPQDLANRGKAWRKLMKILDAKLRDD